MIRLWNAPKQGGSVVRTEAIIRDHGSDIIIAKLRRLNRLPHWNGSKCQLRDELEALCAFHGYIGFEGDPRDYGLHLVGQSLQYDVPLDKRGNLQPFRGKRIRIICLYSGIYRRWLRAGVVHLTGASMGTGRR